jgi:hypothetical protein
MEGLEFEMKRATGELKK